MVERKSREKVKLAELINAFTWAEETYLLPRPFTVD
jgi:hypothetical protein